MRTAVKVRSVSEAMARIVIAGSSSSVRSVSTARATEGARCCAGELTPVVAPMCGGVSGCVPNSQAAQSGQHGLLFVRHAQPPGHARMDLAEEGVFARCEGGHRVPARR